MVTKKSALIGIPVLHIGGTEMQTLNLVLVLLSAGYQVTVCCYYEFNDLMVRRIERTGAKVILMRLKRSNSMLSLMIKLREILTELQPGIVHVQYIAPGLIPILAARLAGVEKVFATVHQPGRIYQWKHRMFIKIAANLCDWFFCNSRSVEESWFGNSQVFDPQKIDTKRKHFTVYNGVDIERIERAGKEADGEKIKELLGIRDKKIIGVVGRLRKEKGQVTLLESMRLVIEILPNAVLVVVGDGPDRPYLEGMMKRLDIDGHLKWLGEKDHDDVLKLYSIMDVVVVPSLFEGFGLTAAEAMAFGKPVVAFDVDGLSELIQSGVNGLLVPPGNYQALADAIVELLLNSAKAASMGVSGRKIVEEKFSVARYRPAMLSAYSGHAESLIGT